MILARSNVRDPFADLYEAKHRELLRSVGLALDAARARASAHVDEVRRRRQPVQGL